MHWTASCVILSIIIGFIYAVSKILNASPLCKNPTYGLQCESSLTYVSTLLDNTAADQTYRIFK